MCQMYRRQVMLHTALSAVHTIDLCVFWIVVQMLTCIQPKGLKVTALEDEGFRVEAGACSTPPDGQEGSFKVVYSNSRKKRKINFFKKRHT